MAERRGGFLLPLLLIVIGIAILLANFGWLPANWWRDLWRLWPLILVFFGLEILFGRGSRAVSLAIALVIVAVVAAVLWFGWPTGAQQSSSAQNVQEELGTVEQAEIDIDFGAGALSISSLSSSSDILVDGDLSLGGDTSFRTQGSQATMRLRTLGDRVFERNDWRLLLSPRPIIDLTVRCGASEANLDFSGLRLRRLNLELGASSASVRLPESVDSFTMTADVGASSLQIEIPQGMAARIRPSIGLTELSVDGSRFSKSGDEYVSPEYSTASRRAELTLRGGASSINVK